MRTGWLREVQRVIAAQESLWEDDVPATRPTDGVIQYEVLSGKLGRLHQEVVASERRAHAQAGGDVGAEPSRAALGQDRPFRIGAPARNRRTWLAPCGPANHRLTYNLMVVYELPELTDDEVDRLFRALADRTRRDILRRTLQGQVTVSQLASRYEMSFAAVQKHVAVLEGAGLVTKQPHGRERLVRADPATIQRAQALLDQFELIWRDRVTQLDALLLEESP